MSFSKSTFHTFLLEQEIICFIDPPIVLKSGKQSYWYANFRKISQNYKKLEKFAQIIADFLLEIALPSVDGVLGVPEGASLLGFEVQKQLVKKGKFLDKIFYFRTQVKQHGNPSDKYWVNGNQPQKLILLEDVSTTGGSLIRFAQKLHKIQIATPLVLGLLDREQLNTKGEELSKVLKNIKLASYFLTKAQNILPLALAKTQNPSFFQQKIREEYQREYQAFQKDHPLCSLAQM